MKEKVDLALESKKVDGLSLPWYNQHYQVDLSKDQGTFNKKPVWMFPLKEAVAFYTNDHSIDLLNNYNSGFIYSQILNC